MTTAAVAAAMALTLTSTAWAGPPPPGEPPGKNGDEHIEFPSVFTPTTKWEPMMQAVPVGDVNGDGRDDVATGMGRDGLPCGECVNVIPTAPGALSVTGLPLPRGFTIRAASLGSGIHDMGDVNGDGRDDIAVATREDVHVVFGRASGEVDVDQLGNDGFTVEHVSVGSTGGTNSIVGNSSLSSIGDQNGDGVRDLAVTDDGAVKVIYTPTFPAGKTVDADALGSGGYTLTTGGGSSFYGPSIAPIGDISGDGREDLAVGAAQGDNSRVDVYGVATPGPGVTVNLPDAVTGGTAFAFSGNRSNVGSAVSAGDQNGDGRQDIAFVVSGSAGRDLYVAFTPALGTVTSFDDIASSKGYRLLPYSDIILNVGDQSGDGIDDLAVTNRVIFTDATARSNPRDLTLANGYFISPKNRFYPAVTGRVNDRDSDGRPEVVVASVDARGDRWADHTTDYAYDVFYSATPQPPTGGLGWGIGNVGENTIQVTGSFGSGLAPGDGWQSVAGIWDPAVDREFQHAGGPATRTPDGQSVRGEVNFDARTALGGAPMSPNAPYYARFGLVRGDTYVWSPWLGPWTYQTPPPGFFGGPPPVPGTGSSTDRTTGITRLLGTGKRDRLRGTAKRDEILGRGGNDWIDGLAGDDVLDGGTGNDTVFGRAGNDKILGGTGADKLSGDAGKDALTGAKGRDKITAGAGDDTISARDKEKDVIDCGSGKDTVTADKKDKVAKNCEKVRRR